CMDVQACLCGQAVGQGVVVIHDFRKTQPSRELGCAKAGFRALSAFRIVSQHEVLGSFSLHFRHEGPLPPAEVQLLEVLGQHLGIAIENIRLSAKAKQLAIAEERNLVAQGLHDSLAQGLNFLNLQVQMLDQATAKRKLDDIREIIPLLQTGVTESYQDVRELLANFRSKLGPGELRGAIHDTISRFTRQTGIEVDL
ncbi:GAF domain-containing protein, partial [Burkholderiaceae bacterium DAT-1]|nr:GAF domain-containing protein [Burkholderiaceae bacterium DAT-1]